MGFASGVSVVTNFKRITESPEVLAEFLDDVTTYCGSAHNCLSCPLYKAKDCDKDGLIEWLQEESE